ncbi:MAG: TlpA family protein disulfide reductase [Flavobacteriales bacterium]
MQNFFAVVLTFLASAVFSQPIQLTGTITGLADENLQANLPKDWFGQSQSVDLAVESNAYWKQIEIPASGWLTLNYKDKDSRFYLWKKAEALKVDFESDFLDTDFSVSGKGASIDSLMRKVDAKFGAKLSTAWLEEQAKDASNIDAMEMETFRLRNDVVFMLKKFEGELPVDFEKAFKNHLGYFYYLSLFKFSEAKTKKSSIPKATEIPKVLIEGLDWERMNKAAELDSEFFRELLMQFVTYKTLEAYDFMKFATKEAAVQEAFNLARENLKGEALQYFLTRTMLENSQNVQPSLLRQMHGFLKGTDMSGAFVKLTSDSLSERLSAKDDEVEFAVAEETDHNRIDIELDGLDGKRFSLSDLKGKVVYLDIWASWCGPCRKEFPHAKALKDKLSKKEKKNIEFLYISIDNTETVWKMAIEQLGIEGKHGLSKGGWGSEATAKFGVKSIPRYLILDKKGKVVDGNAPRASDPRLLEVLKRLAAQ